MRLRQPMSPIMAASSFPTRRQAAAIINNHHCNYEIGHWILLALICLFFFNANYCISGDFKGLARRTPGHRNQMSWASSLLGKQPELPSSSIIIEKILHNISQHERGVLYGLMLSCLRSVTKISASCDTHKPFSVEASHSERKGRFRHAHHYHGNRDDYTLIITGVFVWITDRHLRQPDDRNARLVM